MLLGHGNVVVHRFTESIMAVLLERSQRRLFRPDLSEGHTLFLLKSLPVKVDYRRSVTGIEQALVIIGAPTSAISYPAS